MSHTPGPWRSDKYGMVWATTTAGEMRICDIRGWGHLIGAGALNLPEEQAAKIQDANKSLIAAAPDMLNELQDILSWAIEERAPLGDLEMDSIRRVIAKAIGATA